MKKLVNLVKNGVTYQVGAVSQSDFNSLSGRVSSAETDISTISASTTANTAAITGIQQSLTNIYTKAETDSAITSAISEIDNEIFVITNALPTTGIQTNKIYVVPNTGDTGATNIYIEYLYDEDNSSWEIIGQFKADTDLSGYYTSTQVDSLLAALDKSWFGTQAQYNQIPSSGLSSTVVYCIYEEVSE